MNSPLSTEDEATRQRILSDARNESAKLLDWQSPAAFRRTLDVLDDLIADHNRLLGITGSHRDRVFRHWREGWVLQHIFERLAVRTVRLESGGADQPDAELKLADRSTVAVEITEGMSSSHEPWLRSPPGVYQDRDFVQWRANAAEIPHLLDDAARRKASKPYASRSRLLVYIGTGATWGNADQEIVAAIAAFQARYAGTFVGVNVLWGGTVY